MVKTWKMLLYWMPVLLWMAVIYSASGDMNSMEHSSRLIGPVIQFFFPGISQAALLKGIFLGRKLAHVTVYAMLAALLWVAFMGTFDLKPGAWNWRPVFWSMGLVLLYAASDEMHQMFVPTRQGTPWDVLIDVSGGALALCVIWASGKWRRKW